MLLNTTSQKYCDSNNYITCIITDGDYYKVIRGTEALLLYDIVHLLSGHMTSFFRAIKVLD